MALHDESVAENPRRLIPLPHLPFSVSMAASQTLLSAQPAQTMASNPDDWNLRLFTISEASERLSEVKEVCAEKINSAKNHNLPTVWAPVELDSKLYESVKDLGTVGSMLKR